MNKYHLGHPAWIPVVQHPRSFEWILASGGGRDRSTENGLLHHRGAIPVLCYAIRVMQCSSHIPAADGSRSRWVAMEGVPSLPRRCHRAGQKLPRTPPQPPINPPATP